MRGDDEGREKSLQRRQGEEASEETRSKNREGSLSLSGSLSLRLESERERDWEGVVQTSLGKIAKEEVRKERMFTRAERKD